MMLNADRFSVRVWIAGSVTLAVMALSLAAVGGQGRGGAQAPAAPENVLAGTIEMHQHHDPDERARNTNALDAALYARLRGMRGLVLKSHGQETSGVAWMTALMVPGIEIVSALTLDPPRGGLNKYAVEQFATIVKKANNPSSKIGMVMFPTEGLCQPGAGARSKEPDCIEISKNGQLVPAAVEIIGLVKKHGLILSAGHTSPEDNILIFREGQRQGITQMAATHVNLDPPGLTLAHMQEATKLGAYMEFASKTQRPGGLDGNTGLDNATTEVRNKAVADTLRKLGTQYAILEGDLGAARNELGPDGLEAFVKNLRALGFTKAETDQMTKTNPAKLLGLPPLPAGTSQ